MVWWVGVLGMGTIVGDGWGLELACAQCQHKELRCDATGGSVQIQMPPADMCQYVRYVALGMVNMGGYPGEGQICKTWTRGEGCADKIGQVDGL